MRTWPVASTSASVIRTASILARTSWISRRPTLISHVERPAAVLAEIARIAKPGGSIGIFDGDYASLTFGHPDPDQGKRDDEALIAAIVTNPRVMRQMPVLVQGSPTGTCCVVPLRRR